VESGYAWSHEYTQCVIANALLSYRARVDFDLGFCTPSDPSIGSTENSDDGLVVPSWLSAGKSVPLETGFPSGALEDEYGDVVVPEARQRVNDVEEFLQGLSSDDLDALERYVADDLSEEEAVEPEKNFAARKLRDDDDRDDDVGQSISLLLLNGIF